MLRSNPRPGGISSISAPNLVRPRLTLSRPSHDIGNSNATNPTNFNTNTSTTTTSSSPTVLSDTRTSRNAVVSNRQISSTNTISNNTTDSENLPENHSSHSSKSSGDKGDNILQLLINKFTTALSNSDFKPFRNTYRNNSYPSNEASVLGRNRLSRSFGNINETHTYDTVFSTNSFVIARGVSNNNIYRSKDDSSSGSNRKNNGKLK